MLRGTRIIEGGDASFFNNLIDGLSKSAISMGYECVIFPSIWEQSTFVEKAGEEIIDQMWAFKDKGDREVTLIPEVTAIVQHMWREHWSKISSSKKIFYVNRCYRYEKPQEGRYREFTQFGIEILGQPKEFYGSAKNAREEIMAFAADVFNSFKFWGLDIDFVFNDNVKRGLHYYVNNGFEVEAPWLGAQKQVAGGGEYPEGVGMAIGVDRLILALKKCEDRRGIKVVK